jgi:hypothetical protein
VLQPPIPEKLKRVELTQNTRLYCLEYEDYESEIDCSKVMAIFHLSFIMMTQIV